LNRNQPVYKLDNLREGTLHIDPWTNALRKPDNILCSFSLWNGHLAS
jgi:hypothetical protein